MKSNPRVDWAVLIMRIGLGLIACYYGSQKVFGAFGGPGFQGTVSFMGSNFGIPLPFAVLAMAGEFLGGLGMLFGVLTSVAAFGFACVMAVATYENCKTPGLLQSVLTHGNPADASRVFYTVALLLGAITVMILGGGAFSLDHKIFGPKKKKALR